MHNVRAIHSLLFSFFFREGRSLLQAMAEAWESPQPTAAGKKYSFDRRVIDGYNSRYRELKIRLQKLEPDRAAFRTRLLVPLLVIRVACVVAAAFTSVLITMMVGLLQLIVAPYSFFAGVAAWFLVLPAYVLHYTTFAILQVMTAALFYWFPVLGVYFRITIGWKLIVAWVILDQLMCGILCLLWTPIGRPIQYPRRRVLASVTYGFLNCKTYWLVLLFSLRGFKLDLLAIVLFALIPVRVNSRLAYYCGKFLPAFSLHWLYPSTMFYHSHRMAHLPGVYSHAHRHHHYLHDATPFDANTYGSGHAEEWLKLATEISVSLLTGLVPHSLSPSTIKASFGNAVLHTRIQGDHPFGDNFHVNHHAHYQRNFGTVFYPVDLLLETEYGDVSSLGSPGNQRLVCTREATPEAYSLEIRRSPERSSEPMAV